MTLYLENYDPAVKQGKGIYTKYSTNAVTQVLASNPTINQPTTGGTIFQHTPTQNETINAPIVVAGQTVRYIVTTSGTTSYTITFGTNFKSQGTLSTGTVSGKVFIVEFVGDNVNGTYDEIARTTAM